MKILKDTPNLSAAKLLVIIVLLIAIAAMWVNNKNKAEAKQQVKQQYQSKGVPKSINTQ